MQSVTTPKAAPAVDVELVRRALSRDEAAVRAIIKANNRRLYRLARGILRQDDEAEDVVQETYVRTLTHLAEFQPVDVVSRIAMNEALGRLRRQRPGVELSSLPSGTLEAQIIRFPSCRPPTIRKEPWPNVKSSMSSKPQSTSCPNRSAWSSSPASSKA
jgi:RNA polymerase sigma-70 factor, ECF subfamily